MKTLAYALLLCLAAMTAMAADVTGKWSGTISPEGHDPSNAYLIVKQSGATLTGSAGPDEGQQWPLTNGKIEGNKITGDVTSPDGVVYKVELTVDGDRMTGRATAIRDGETMKAKLELSRVKS
jgi:hypothetical protein